MEKQRKLALTEEEKSVNIVDVFMYLIAHWNGIFFLFCCSGDVSGTFIVRLRLYIVAWRL